MKNSIKSKALCLLLCIAMLSALPGCGAANNVLSSDPLQALESTGDLGADNKESTPASPESSETSGASAASVGGLIREDSLKQLEEIEKKYQQNPDDQPLSLEYSQKLFELGEFQKSQEIVKPLLNDENPSADAMYLSANIEYITGNYDQAEKLYNLLIEQYPDEFKTNAEVGLLFIYYQTNQYKKSQNLFEGLEDAIELPIWDMMKDFGDENPYQIDWKGKNEVVVPFIITDPLPIVPVEINGKKINALIDTGGPMFVVDNELASSLGVNTVSKQEGEFAGGQTAEIGFGRANSLVINGVALNNIPVMTAPFSGFSNTFSDVGMTISGIIGTNVLEQFVATMDYPGGQLILRPRNETGRDALKAELAQEEKIAELPFVLASTHYIFSKGSINGKDGFNFFVDSGMDNAQGASLLLPKETMDYVSIPLPKMRDIPEGYGGMGGSGYQEGYFDMDTLCLGNLQQKNSVGVYDGADYAYDEALGFFNDGLISHNFLKNYKWTIDFDSMKMIFSQ